MIPDVRRFVSRKNDVTSNRAAIMATSSLREIRVTISIADADDHNRQPFSDLFQSGKFQTFCAKGVGQALTVLHHERIDIALVDGTVPKTNGLTACRTLRINRETWLAPLLLLTSWGSAQGHPIKQEEGQLQGGKLSHEDTVVRLYLDIVLLATDFPRRRPGARSAAFME